MKELSENEIQRAVFSHLRTRGAPGIFAFHPKNASSDMRGRRRGIYAGLGIVPGIPDVIVFKRAELKAYRAAAEILLEAYPNASEDVDDKCNCTQCRSERTVNALRTAGISTELHGTDFTEVYALELKRLNLRGKKHTEHDEKQRECREILGSLGVSQGVAFGLDEALEWLEDRGLLRGEVK